MENFKHLTESQTLELIIYSDRLAKTQTSNYHDLCDLSQSILLKALHKSANKEGAFYKLLQKPASTEKEKEMWVAISNIAKSIAKDKPVEITSTHLEEGNHTPSTVGLTLQAQLELELKPEKLHQALTNPKGTVQNKILEAYQELTQTKQNAIKVYAEQQQIKTAAEQLQVKPATLKANISRTKKELMTAVAKELEK